MFHRGNMNGGGGSEPPVTRRIWLVWKAFNNMSSMLRDKRYTWNIKEKIYRTCVRHDIWLRNLSSKVR